MLVYLAKDYSSGISLVYRQEYGESVSDPALPLILGHILD